jgi:hypothetical protein
VSKEGPVANGPELLDAAESARLVNFARTCRAAARAVALYPPEHPAIGIALDRLADVCARTVSGSLQVSVSPGALMLGGRRAARPEAAVTELADLLHAHHVGVLDVRPGADSQAWLTFLRLLAASPEELQRQGGLARQWATAAGRSIEIHEIDYASVLRERETGEAATWDRILQSCLHGETFEFDDQTLQLLAEIAGDADRLVDLARRLEEAAANGSKRSAAAALLAMLRRLMAMLEESRPNDVAPILDTVAVAARRFSPELVVELLAAKGGDAGAGPIDLSAELLARFTEQSAAEFVANSVVASHGATARLAAAFFALVPEPERRPPVLSLAQAQAAMSSLGRSREFERVWQGVEELLGSYTDEAYVSTDYAKDLATARVKAGEIDIIVDDPPERIAAWLATVADGTVRALDLQMLLDLLRIESDPLRWQDVADVAVAHVEDLLLVGDCHGAVQLVEGISAAESPSSAPAMTDGKAVSRDTAARAALDRLVAGHALAQVDLQGISDEEYADVKRMCVCLGARVIGPLAELLAVEERGRSRQRLTDVLLSFGALGRQCAEQLMSAPNANVRRVAVYLLREFGGKDALPDLAALLDDAEPNVQREAVRAILQIGTDEAYSVLESALRSGTAQTRDSILRLVEAAGEEHGAPLFTYIVRRSDRSRRFRPVYLKAVAALGRLGGDEEIDVLKDVLYRAEWWAPRSTAVLRQAAATSLRRLGTLRAFETLREAHDNGPRGVRAAVRPHVMRNR